MRSKDVGSGGVVDEWNWTLVGVGLCLMSSELNSYLPLEIGSVFPAFDWLLGSDFRCAYKNRKG